MFYAQDLTVAVRPRPRLVEIPLKNDPTPQASNLSSLSCIASPRDLSTNWFKSSGYYL